MGKRKPFSPGENLEDIATLVLNVLTNHQQVDRIQYWVRCTRCDKEQKIAHSTLRYRMSQKTRGCAACKTVGGYGVVPPAWPVPESLKT